MSVVPVEAVTPELDDVAAARLPVSDVPTVTAVPAATLAGKSLGSDC